MKYFFISIPVLMTILSGCVPVIHPKNKVQIDTLLKSCTQAKYDDQTGLILGIDKIRWEDKLVNNSINYLPKSQKRMYEQQFTAQPTDKFLVFDIYLQNNSNQPLMWKPQNAPVFQLIDQNGARYAASGQKQGNLDDFSAKVISGSSLNPQRILNGTTAFDVPTMGNYQLEVAMGVPAGGWSVQAGRVIMKCIVDVQH